VCDPYLNLFRGIIPPLGGTMDLSPILAFLTLNVGGWTGAGLDGAGWDLRCFWLLVLGGRNRHCSTQATLLCNPHPPSIHTHPIHPHTQVFQGTAAALPCELPAEGAAAHAGRAPRTKQQLQQQQAAAPAAAGGVFAPFSKYQQAWAKRVAAQRQKRLVAEAGARA